MPALVTSPSQVNPDNNSSTVKTRKQTKRTRIARRRGRGPGDIESDEEIERELATDSESEDAVSSLDPDSDSEAESVSEVVPNPLSRAFTPNTSQSPGDRGSKVKGTVSNGPFFTSSGGDWSEMVTEEKANGPADLPVIDFTDFDGQNVPSRPTHQKKHKKNPKKAQNKSLPPSQPNGHQASNETEVTQQAESTSRSPTLPYMKRAPGQSARQAYQQRLDNDPSYVPTVGGFWGHDDRLLDKDLRSLSGWWRGRWQGYGRGGGYVRGRGRAGTSRVSGDGDERQQAQEGNGTDVPAIERAWTHDRFEEMKQREENRRALQHTQTQAIPPPQGTSSFRGARGATAVRRGRGGRGGFSSPVERSLASSGRIWFSKKPELMWTKQHEGFLYFELDPSLKPKQGQGQGIQVRLPGKQPKIVRAPPRFHWTIKAPLPISQASNVTASEQCVVNLPRKAKHGMTIVPAEKTTSSVLSDEVSAVIETAPRDPFIETTTMDILSPVLGSRTSPSYHSDTLAGTSSSSHQEAAVRLQLEHLSIETEHSDPARLAKTEEAVLKNPPADAVAVTAELPLAAQPDSEGRLATIHTLPTVYSPPISQPSPLYGSPYAYPPALPPGIAINQHGMTYEVATGRPVYLQAPPPIYNPLPILPSHPPPTSFTPGHIPHPSHSHSHSHSAVSPDFLAHSPASHTPPMNGFIDPSTGTPIFSFPRQTSRIEIRAPDGSPSLAVKSPLSKAPIPGSSSSLRNTAARFEPASRALSDAPAANGYFPASSPENGVLPSYAPLPAGVDAQQQQQQQESAEAGSVVDGAAIPPDQTTMMAAYPHYVQQYYYPDTYGYMHNPYVDMSQVRPYEMYPPHEGTVYY